MGRKYLAIVGDLPSLDFPDSRMFYKQIMGAAARIMMNDGIPIGFIPTNNDFINLLVLLNSKAEKGESTILQGLYRHHLSVKDHRIRALCAIPGIGPKLAKEMLKRWTINQIANRKLVVSIANFILNPSLQEPWVPAERGPCL